MDGWIELNAEEAKSLFNTMRVYQEDGSLPGLNKIRIFTDGHNVKIKVNEGVWSPPLGKKVEAN